MRRATILMIGWVFAASMAAATPATAACAPDARYADVPDGMEYDPSTCVLRDPLGVDARSLAARQGILPDVARQWLQASAALDQTLGLIEVRNPETFAGFQWTWSAANVALVARFKGEVPPAVITALADAGVEVRYLIVEHSLAELDALAVTTSVLLGQVSEGHVAAVDIVGQRVVASVSSDDLTPAERARIAAFAASHPTVSIEIVDGPVWRLY